MTAPTPDECVCGHPPTVHVTEHGCCIGVCPCGAYRNETADDEWTPEAAIAAVLDLCALADRNPAFRFISTQQIRQTITGGTA